MALDPASAVALSARLYRQVLNRDPDAGGLNYYAGALEAGALDEAGVRQSLASSPEAANLISSYYQAVLDRAPDAPGLAQYQAALGAGALGAVTLRADLAVSAEAANRVSDLYVQALGRTGDAPGVAAALAALRGAADFATLRANLAHSTEAVDSLTRAYNYQFGLAPSADTLALQVRELTRGRPFDDVVAVTSVPGRISGFFFDNYGYLIPATYSDTGMQQFVRITSSGSRIGIRTPVTPIPSPAVPPGPDNIVLDLTRTIGSPPIAFIAFVDGQPLGSATVTSVAPDDPLYSSISVDEITFTSAIGPGLHRLTLQTADPAAGALIVQSATYNGVPVLRQGTSTTTTQAGTLDLFLRTEVPPVTVLPPSSVRF